MLPRIGSLAFGFAVLIVFIYIIGVGPVERALLQVNPAVIAIMVLIQFLGSVFYAGAWYVPIRATCYCLSFIACQGITLSLSSRLLQSSFGRVLRFVRSSIGAIQKEVTVDREADQFLKKYHSNFQRILVSKVLIALFRSEHWGRACSVMILWVVLPTLGADVSFWIVAITMAIDSP